MTRRLEAGPALVALGAILMLVSLFLEWYDPSVTAWVAFEVFDVLLTALAVGALAAAVGLLAPELAYLDRVWLPVTTGAALVIVATQLLDPPPTVGDGDRGLGGWLALAGAVLMAIGTVLTFGRLHLAVEVERRDPRRRVAAVDARREREASGDTGETAAVPGARRSEVAREEEDPDATQPFDAPGTASRGGPLLPAGERAGAKRRRSKPAAEPGPEPERKPAGARRSKPAEDADPGSGEGSS